MGVRMRFWGYMRCRMRVRMTVCIWDGRCRMRILIASDGIRVRVITAIVVFMDVFTGMVEIVVMIVTMVMTNGNGSRRC